MNLLIKCKNKIIFSLNVLVILFFYIYISVSCASKSYNRDNYKYRKLSSACSIYLRFGTRNQVSILSFTPVIRCLGFPIQIRSHTN